MCLSCRLGDSSSPNFQGVKNDESILINSCNPKTGHLLDIMNVSSLVEFLPELSDCCLLTNRNDVTYISEKYYVRITFNTDCQIKQCRGRNEL